MTAPRKGHHSFPSENSLPHPSISIWSEISPFPRINVWCWRFGEAGRLGCRKRDVNSSDMLWIRPSRMPKAILLCWRHRQLWACHLPPRADRCCTAGEEQAQTSIGTVSTTTRAFINNVQQKAPQKLEGWGKEETSKVRSLPADCVQGRMKSWRTMGTPGSKAPSSSCNCTFLNIALTMGWPLHGCETKCHTTLNTSLQKVFLFLHSSTQMLAERWRGGGWFCLYRTRQIDLYFVLSSFAHPSALPKKFPSLDYLSTLHLPRFCRGYGWGEPTPSSQDLPVWVQLAFVHPSEQCLARGAGDWACWIMF